MTLRWMPFLLIASVAEAADFFVNPETMGPNALPTPYAEQPWTLPHTEIMAGAATQWGRRYDHAFVPTFRLALPIGKWVTAYFEGMPFEVYWSSPETRAEWGATDVQGVSKADVYFGAKFLFFDGTAKNAPSIAFRALTKSTSGKHYEQRRFTNAPGYLLNLIVGQRFTVTPQVLISIYGNIGFWIWQQGANSQNDALNGAIAMHLNWVDRGSVIVETRAYGGYQSGDKTLVQSLRMVADVTRWFSAGVTGNIGFIAAPRLEGRLDLIFKAPSLLPWILE